MKKILSLVLVAALCFGVCASLTSCSNESKIKINPDKEEYVVGICQLMKHDSLDKATEGFIAALTEELAKEGRTVRFDTQVPGDSNLCPTVINTFVANDVDLIMANATPALLAAANATASIPVLGTSVTDYEDTFSNVIPENVTGTSDAVPFAEQAQMMIDTLGLVSGDKVGVIYCTNESNSLIQYEAVKALFEAKGIVVTAYTFSETTELQGVAQRAASESKAIYVPSDNTVANSDTIVGNVCNEALVPVYTSYGGSICYASLAIDYYQLGVETGRMAANILLGKTDMKDVSVVTLTPTVTYNEEICAILGIAVPEN